MVKISLVIPDVEIGSEIIRLLDEADFPVTVALWVLWSRDGEWEYVIATPLYDKVGLKECYGRLLAALQPLDQHVVHEIRFRILGHKKPLIRGLRRAYGKDKSVEGRHLRGPAPGSKIWIEDSYVYRIK